MTQFMSMGWHKGEPTVNQCFCLEKKYSPISFSCSESCDTETVRPIETYNIMLFSVF